jgi:hypothetical protein
VVFIDPWGLEKLVVSGGAYHYGNGDYQYEFVDSALLQISILGSGTTLLIANAGWNEEQYNAIVQAAADRSINLVWFSNIDNLTNYINTGGINGSGNRANDPITSFYVFSHGTDGFTGNYAITFGLYAPEADQLNWTNGDISGIKGSAFANGVTSVFYACRTGNTFSGNGNFAQLWSDKTGGTTYAYCGMGSVYVGRSDYSNILGTALERHGLGSAAFNAWRNARGEITVGPGEAWRFPETSYLTYLGIFNPTVVVPPPQPGPPR